MKEITIKTQKDYDKLKDDVAAYIYIVGGTEKDPLTINRALPNAYVYIKENAFIESVYDSATIESVSGSATIKYVYGSATIESVYGSATIKYVSGSATIKYVYGSATIESVSGSATIESVSGSATIESVYGSATLPRVAGLASVLMVTDMALVSTFGHNIVRTVSNEKNTKITVSKNTTLITVEEEVKYPVTFEGFATMYPVEAKKTKAILYKSVHKRDGRYIADYDKTTEYVVGETIKGTVDRQHNYTCSKGLHVAHKTWAINFGRWDDQALLECEVPISKIIVAKDTDGKVRTSELKVLREVPREEW